MIVFLCYIIILSTIYLGVLFMKMPNIFYQIILLVIFTSVPAMSQAQYKWVPYAGDPKFLALEDGIDNGRIIYHQLAQNSSALAGNRGLMFNATLFAFPSLTGSFAWSQVRVNIGKISFYPHIFTFDKGTSSLSLAILYNISRVSPVRGVRTRPSFTPTSLLQLEKEKMNFTKLKFVSEGYEAEILLQPGNQETELSLSDYDVNYNYWIKSTPTQKEAMALRTFFARPLKTFNVRAYSDKGYLDTTLAGAQVTALGDIFVSTVDLYQRLIDPNYINTPPPTNAVVVKKPVVKKVAPKPVAKKAVAKKPAPKKKAVAKKPAPKKKAVAKKPAPKKKPVAKKKPTRKKATPKKVVTTNRRPKVTRVVKPT